MQLPEELVREVREFSKPLLRYPREYKAAIAPNKKEWSEEEWPELKKKLSSPEAEQILPELRAYLEAKSQLHTYLAFYNETVANNPACELSQVEQDHMMTKLYFVVAKEMNSSRKLSWKLSIA
jgi:hypothetical protein